MLVLFLKLQKFSHLYAWRQAYKTSQWTPCIHYFYEREKHEKQQTPCSGLTNPHKKTTMCSTVYYNVIYNILQYTVKCTILWYTVMYSVLYSVLQCTAQCTVQVQKILLLLPRTKCLSRLPDIAVCKLPISPLLQCARLFPSHSVYLTF